MITPVVGLTDCFSLRQCWRQAGLKTHVLVLTARGSLADKVRGLNLGADGAVPAGLTASSIITSYNGGKRRSAVGTSLAEAYLCLIPLDG